MRIRKAVVDSLAKFWRLCIMQHVWHCACEDVGKELLNSVKAELTGRNIRPRDSSRWYHYVIFGVWLVAYYALCRVIFY